jgi:hypothetical protein
MSFAELPPFDYTPLATGEIRLLVPDHASENGLYWQLQTVRLDTEPDFDALSYTWGSQADTYSISCNHRQLQVHHNLFVALPYLARRGEKKEVTAQPIWIDAVCINQADNDEKNIQINLMHQIYRSARKVWIWLGLTKDLNQLVKVLSLLPTITAYNNKLRQVPQESKPERPSELWEIDTSYRDTILHVFQNPWFYRVWVVQEAVLARNISFLFGEHEVDFATLDGAIDSAQAFRRWDWRDTKGKPVRVAYMVMDDQVIPTIRTFFRSQEVHAEDTVAWRPLRVVLLMTGNLECFAPQDRISGMMGLLKEMDPNVPGFDRSASVVDLYTAFSRYIMSKSTRDHFWWQYLNMSFSLTRREGLPSWVPDFHYQTEPYTCGLRNIRVFQSNVDERYKASSGISHFKLGQQLDEISLDGKILDSVVMVHPSFPQMSGSFAEVMPKELMATLVGVQEWESTLASLLLPGYSMEAKGDTVGTAPKPHVNLETYWRTLMADSRVGPLDGGYELTSETWQTFCKLFAEGAKIFKKVVQ